MNFRGRLFFVALLPIFFIAQVQAESLWNFEQLLMPGKLIQGHAEYESDCKNCHVLFEKSSQDSLCLDCHEEIASDIDGKSGFHGRAAQPDSDVCNSCHLDHKGRDHDIIRLDRDSFNHALTDFPLEGNHRIVNCDGCHVPTEKYSEAPGQCIDCHEEDDRHRGNLGEDCVDCHSYTGWDQTKFDHATTDFTLNGQHEDVSCGACHPDERYKDIETQCHSCHAINDVHGGKRGSECDQCHSESKWDESLFDHTAETDFVLRGNHKNLQCESCHRGPTLEDTAGDLCIDCHESTDTHSGRNGSECQDCHSEISWSESRFEHDKETDFALRGKHAERVCVSCHTGPIYEDKLESQCIACHALEDVHNGGQGSKCNNCHSEESWNASVAFDHELTDFPLIGLHAVVACEECHVEGGYENTSVACYSCHKESDEHKGALGQACFNCHTPNGWDLWRFNHAKQTDYPLEGAHENLECGACHKKPVKDKVRQSSLCVNCHRDDDSHNGSFGDRCDRCHANDRFDNIQNLWR